MGPPAERLYAVEPVGVDTMTPSARNSATGLPSSAMRKVEIRASASRLRTASLSTQYLPWCGPREITRPSAAAGPRETPRQDVVEAPGRLLLREPGEKAERPRFTPSSGVPEGAARATDSNVPSPPRTKTRSVSRAIRARATPPWRRSASAVSVSKTTRRPRRLSARSRIAARPTADADPILATIPTRRNFATERRDPFILLNLHEIRAETPRCRGLPGWVTGSSRAPRGRAGGRPARPRRPRAAGPPRISPRPRGEPRRGRPRTGA